MFSLEITGADALLNFKAFKIVARFFAFFLCKISNAISNGLCNQLHYIDSYIFFDSKLKKVLPVIRRAISQWIFCTQDYSNNFQIRVTSIRISLLLFTVIISTSSKIG